MSSALNPKRSYADFGLNRSYWQIRYALQKRKSAEEDLSELFDQLQSHEAWIAQLSGCPIKEKKILELGPGQSMERALYFGLHNEVTGIDLDVIPFGWDLEGYRRLVLQNGLGRLLKTVGKKAILQFSYRQAWKKLLNTTSFRWPKMIFGDICEMQLTPDQYDLVISWSVFEHLPKPNRALENLITALKPGGVLFISLHLFSSFNGGHDIRQFTGLENLVPAWGHLRPSVKHQVKPSAYLNEWRLSQWRDLFREMSPGYLEHLEKYDSTSIDESLFTPEIKAEIASYTTEELFTVDAVYLWKKPEPYHG